MKSLKIISLQFLLGLLLLHSSLVLHSWSTMGTRSLDITLLSADDLKNVNLITNMHVYAIVTVSGESQTTYVDRDCGIKPHWNHRMRFTINEAPALQANLHVTYSVKASGGCLGDSDLGGVYIPIKEMLSQSNNGVEEKNMTYNITTPGGRSKGILNVSFKFSPPPPQPMPTPPALAMAASTMCDTPLPAMSYTPPPQGGPGGYPPPQDHHHHHTGCNSSYPPTSQGGYPPPDNQHAGSKNSYPRPLQGGYPPPDQHGGYPAPQNAAPPPPLYSAYPPPAWYPQPSPPPPGCAKLPQPQVPVPAAAGGYNYPPPPPSNYGNTAGAATAVYSYPGPKQGNGGGGLGMASGGGIGMGAGVLGGLALGSMMNSDSDSD